MHQGKGGIKLHTLLDVRGAIPCVIHVDSARPHDVNMLDRLSVEPGAIYLMDRGYLDFARLFRVHASGAFFVMRAKRNLQVIRRRSHEVVDRDVIVCDQLVVLRDPDTYARFPSVFRRLRVRDPDSGGAVVLLTNQLTLPATVIGALYRQRWQVEIFFRWIKQHLRIRAFYGRTINAVKTQVWIAVSVYLLVAIVRKRLHVSASLRTMLQALSATLFEELPLQTVFSHAGAHVLDPPSANQLNLFGD
jgi:IS4 transposase